MEKRGAIELSIGTIVIIVLAMSMLILGLVLVKNIFSGSSENILQMNDKVKDQINKLFVEDKKVIVSLTNQKAVIKQNEDWGIPFAIRNIKKNTAEASKFSYEVKVSDPDVRQKCGISEKEVESWIQTGRSDTVALAPGETYYGIVRFFIPEGAPLCIVRFHLEVKADGQTYQTESFDVQVEA